MKNTIKTLTSIGLLSMICLGFIPSTTAYSDERISVYFYFTLMQEDGSWHEWRNISKDSYIKGQTLQVGQPVKCKIVVIPNAKCVFNFELSEIGSPRAFDLLEGDYEAFDRGYGFDVNPIGTDIERIREVVSQYGNPPEYLFIGDTVEYEWVLQPNSNYADEAWSGLSLNCDFVAQSFTSGDDVRIGVSFTEAVISGEWTGPSYSSGSSNNNGNTNGEGNTNAEKKSTPGFEFLLFFLAFIGVFLVVKKPKNR